MDYTIWGHRELCEELEKRDAERMRIQQAHRLAAQKYGDYTEARNALSIIATAISATN